MTTNAQSILAQDPEFQKLVKFVTRRFDEISAEIHSSTQLLDMAEESIAKRFNEVLTALGAISYQGVGGTPHNVGMELDAVVKTTEDAANRILTAAESISRLVEDNLSKDQQHNGVLKDIAHYTQDILAACAFQDLTGQRIGRTLHNIRHAEAELAETLKRIGIKIEPHSGEARVAAETNQVQSQSDIDNLFN